MNYGKGKIPGQRPSNRTPYSPEVQPDMQSQAAARGAKPAYVVPKFLQNDGDPLHARTAEQIARETELEVNSVGLRASPRSIIDSDAGVFALTDAGGVVQNIPPDINFVMVANVPMAYDETTNTYLPASLVSTGVTPTLLSRLQDYQQISKLWTAHCSTIMFYFKMGGRIWF